MTNYLLGAILVMLILNGNWPVRAHRYITGLARRMAKDISRRWRNARAKKRKAAARRAA